MDCFVNIIITDEALLQQEACDIIIARAKKAGAFERDVVDVTDKFSWDELYANSGSLSLFSEAKLTDIRFNKAPKKDAHKALIEILATADQDSQYLVRLPKLDKSKKNAKWFKTISKNANVQEFWPPKAEQFPGWILNRARKQALDINNDAIAMLADQTEGNLLSAHQNLQKLGLLFPEQKITLEMIKEVSSNSAKYSVFLCLDEAIAGRGERAVTMLKSLQQESIAPISILINLTREILFCTQIAISIYKGRPPMESLASRRDIWDSKKNALGAAAQRLPLAFWQKLLARCAFIDRLVKGQEVGDVWRELESCLWMMSGKKIWRGQSSSKRKMAR